MACVLKSVKHDREFDGSGFKNVVSTVCSQIEEVPVYVSTKNSKTSILNKMQRYADKITHAVDGSQDRYRVCCFIFLLTSYSCILK